MALPSPRAFVIERRRCEGAAVHLLPTANAVLALGVSPRLVLPHRRILELTDVSECVSLTPNVVKCLLGPPRRFLDRVLEPRDHPLLAPFAGVTTFAEAATLLDDLRASLTVTPDEADFVTLWDGYLVHHEIPTSDRTVQRLCLRYAGQSPTVINTVSRLSRTLDADTSSRLYNGLGEFSDASHFARVCREYTGQTPASWRNLSHPFY